MHRWDFMITRSRHHGRQPEKRSQSRTIHDRMANAHANRPSYYDNDAYFGHVSTLQMLCHAAHSESTGENYNIGSSGSFPSGTLIN